MRYLLIAFLVLSLFLGCGDSNSVHQVEKKTETQKTDADKTQNVMENYQPSLPVDFPHAIHSGELGIDCKYCHSPTKDSENLPLPSIHLCKNCHNAASDVASIKELDENDSSENPRQIVWRKVNNLPDSIYLKVEKTKAGDHIGQFNHADHVVSGKIDCKSCHEKSDTSKKINLDENFCSSCHY